MAVRSQYVVNDLRKRIVDGVYPIGSQLPSRISLQKQYGTTPVTLQRAFRHLVHEGFVETRMREGSFVSKRPPHINRYFLVFPYSESAHRTWPQFWRAIVTESRVLAKQTGNEIIVSFANQSHEDSASYKELLNVAKTHRLAGLIFTSSPFYLKGSPLLESNDIPCVGIMDEDHPPNVKAVKMADGLIEAGIQKLLALKRHKIALIVHPGQLPYLPGIFNKLGITVPPYWIQSATVENALSMRPAVHLLMSGTPDRRPNGLLILDDNLVPHATAGILNAGVHMSAQVAVVAHANFPHVTPSAVPAYRIGYNVHQVLAVCIQCLENMQHKKRFKRPMEVPWILEDQRRDACVSLE